MSWHYDYVATIQIDQSPAPIGGTVAVEKELEELIGKLQLPKAGKRVVKVTVKFMPH